MSIILGRHLEKMDDNPELKPRIDIDEFIALIIDAEAHVSGTLPSGFGTNGRNHGVLDSSVDSASITPASGEFANVYHDMQVDVASTFPTYVAGTNGSASYFEFNGKDTGLITQDITTGSRQSFSAVGGGVGGSATATGSRNTPGRFATTVNLWVKDDGMITGSHVVAQGQGTGSNLQHSKIYSFDSDAMSFGENNTNVTLYHGLMSAEENPGNVPKLKIDDNGFIFDNSVPSLSGSLNGADVPFNGAVFGYVAENLTGSNEVVHGMSNVSHSLIISTRIGSDDGDFGHGDRGYGESLSGSFQLWGTTNEQYISGSSGSCYEHIGSPVSGSVVTIEDLQRPGLEFELDVIDVQQLITSSNATYHNVQTGEAKVLILHETVRVNGVEQFWSGSDHQNSFYIRPSAGGGNHFHRPRRLTTFKLATKTDQLEFYQNGYTTIKQNGENVTLKKSDGWVNLCVVSKVGQGSHLSGSNASHFGQETRIYKNGELVQTIDGVGRYIGDGGTPRNFRLGKSGTAFPSHWRGKLGFASVYNKELTASEVRANYFALKERYLGK